MGSLKNSIRVELRRAALISLGFAAAFTMLGSAALAQTPPSVGTASFTVFPGGLVNIPTSIMIKKGFLAKQGVTDRKSVV